MLTVASARERVLTGDQEGRGAGQLTAGARSRDLVLAAVLLLSVANTQRVLVSRARHRYLAATRQLRAVLVPINQLISFYLLKMSRDRPIHKRLFNCEQDNKAETNTNSCPTNKLYYERKGKIQCVQNSIRWRAHTHTIQQHVDLSVPVMPCGWEGNRRSISHSSP